MKNISDIYLLSDVDGTLIGHDLVLPQKNIDAICRFVEKGGNFALATGRSIESARKFVELLPVNFPCILFNGCSIYDYKLEKEIYTQYLTDVAVVYLKKILQEFPHIGATVLIGPDYYDVSPTIDTDRFSINRAVIDELPPHWYKVLFHMEPEFMKVVGAFTEDQSMNDVLFVKSNTYYFEMLPNNTSKASALEKLMQVLDINASQVIAIGDYYNDLEMLKLAGFSATIETSPDDIKEHADLIVCRCEDGAVADLIEHIERYTLNKE
ncbi:MAG: HAD family hydrolase [Oscillospiraceae bacterium]